MESKSKFSARRLLMEALRTQDILDIEEAIAANAENSNANNGDISRSSAATASSISMAGAMDLNRLLLETKKMYLSLMNHCKHLLKPLRQAMRRLDGPQIVTSLDCIYRAPSTVQKMMLRDAREAERILRLMSNAALDAKKMFTTDHWEEIDGYLRTYESVLTESVVVELANIRDALRTLRSPHKNHVSPSRSPREVSPHEDEVMVSPSLDRRSPPEAHSQYPTSIILSPPSADKRRFLESANPTPALSPVATSWEQDASSLHSPSSDANSSVNLLRKKLQQYAAAVGSDVRDERRDMNVSPVRQYGLYRSTGTPVDGSSTRSLYDERRKMQLRIAKQLAPEEFDSRQQVSDVETSARMNLYRDMVQSWATTADGCGAIARRVDSLILNRPYYRSPMRGELEDEDDVERYHHRRRYRFLKLEPQSTEADPFGSAHRTERHVRPGGLSAETRRQLSYNSGAHQQQQQPFHQPPLSTSGSRDGASRSGAPSPQTRSVSAEQDVALALGLNTGGGSSAATSAEASRTSSPVPFHPSGESHHLRPPRPTHHPVAATSSSSTVGGSRAAPLYSPPMELLSAESVFLLEEGEWTGRSFIQDKEAFSRGVELDVCYSRIQLHQKAMSRPARHQFSSDATSLSHTSVAGSSLNSTGVYFETSTSHHHHESEIRVTLGDSHINKSKSSGRDEDDLHPVRLGRWGMNRDPYSTFDRSPERVDGAPGTARHHSEALSLKSPSPPSASDDDE
ncbi:Hypothetical protein, putative [Bodo saltans]|uniref:Uncharacterized protein n=1 Tax=Bodo saltans TaxID=75058 RepID=A0A0S4JU55_BODSA|nr:Hypothetical protein, putative [Bodo saltans]|eukprot:CUG94114.1 Hypothetical protein, putative [Bodo saltans]